MAEESALPRTLRPVWAEVNLDHLAHNVREIRRRIGPRAEIMAVVKANAYGHGAGPVAKVALESGASCLAVALVEEAHQLRREGIGAPIHLLSMPTPDQADAVVAGGFSCAVCAREVAEALSAAAVRLGRAARVQVKIDTGMGRLGLLPAEVPEFRRYLGSLPGIEVIGAFTHFASADEADKSYTRRQFELFRAALSSCEGPPLTLAHVANSAAVIDLPELAGTLVRPGIMLYGLYPSAEVSRTAVNLKPVMALKARVAFVKRLPAGAAVSYGRTYVTRNPETVALLPLGYADGLSRLLSNRAEVLLGGERAPLRGRVCMDQCVVGVPEGLEVRMGDEAVIFGRQGGEEISVDEVAKRSGTINYEVVCAVSGRVPRVYLRGGQVSEIRSFRPEMAPLTP
jgi:alanine racemase